MTINLINCLKFLSMPDLIKVKNNNWFYKAQFLSDYKSASSDSS